MGFEGIVRTLSKWVAGAFVFVLAAGFYLAAKGFVMGEDGVPVLVNNANASLFEKKEIETKKIEKNFVFPEGRFIGDKNAPVTIYEYSSFGCTHCADFHLNTLEKIKKDYVSPGKVRVLLVPFPLDKKSMMAAVVSECVPDDKYHEFVKLMFKKQREWGMSVRSDKIIAQYAALSGVSDEKFKSCVKDEKISDEILTNRQFGITELGIKGTPSFVIANRNDREILYGAPDYEEFRVIIDKMLGEKKAEK